MGWGLENFSLQQTTKDSLVKKDPSVRYKGAGKKRIL